MSIYGVKNLPKAKWLIGISGDTEQVGLLSDCVDWETAILEYLGLLKPPPLTWATTSTIKVLATTNSPAHMLFAGFPDVLHSGQFINPVDITDGKLREITADETLDMTSTKWGAEKASTWYAVYATAADVDTDFGLKAMPYLRVHTDAANIITTRDNLNTNAAFDYAFTADEHIDSYIYILSGAKKGYTALITDNGVAGGGTAITYDGDGLGLAAGDWFIILPATNFRWLGDVFNNSSSNLLEFKQDGHVFRWAADQPLSVIVAPGGTAYDIRIAPPMATMALVKGTCGQGKLYVGHPSMANQRVLMEHSVTLSVWDTDHHDDVLTPTFTPGYQPVWIDNCGYSMVNDAACTLYSGGYGYSAGYLGY